MRAEPNLQAAKLELKHIVAAVNSDPASRNLMDHAAVLLKDVRQNEEGHLLDYSLANQFRRILVPLLIETFREIKLPPIKGVTLNKKYQYHVHGIVLSSIELLPESILLQV